MYNFGIHGYQPQWLSGRDAIIATHGRRLAALVGHRLQHVWLVWDVGADEWLVDWPVLLDFGDERVAINHMKSDDVSVTFDTIDPTEPLETDGVFQATWRSEPLAQLATLPGQQLCHIDLLEWVGGTVPDRWEWLTSGPSRPGSVDPADWRMADGVIGLGLTFTAEQLIIYNAGDQNGLAFSRPTPSWNRHRLA